MNRKCVHKNERTKFFSKKNKLCFREEKPVVCCDQSEHDLVGEKLENMNKVAKKFCPDISMDRVVMEEIM